MSKKSGKSAPVAPKKVGNTLPSSSLWWVFTSFEVSDCSELQLGDYLCGSQYLCQIEICPETKREHYQGVVRFVHKKRLKQLKKEQPKWHWEKCKNIKQSKAYCSKDETRKPGTKPFGNLDFDEPLRTLTTLRKWQQKLFEKLQKPTDDRTVNWYWEDDGNIGKSSFARYMVIKYNSYYVCGSAADMKNGLTNYYEVKQCFPKIVFLDIPRDSLGCSYKGIEQLKNGIFFNTKFKGMMLVFNPPHVVVFANQEPDDTRMSKDRWNIVEINAASADGEAEAQLVVASSSFADTDSD